jgi:hypothetical protein
MRRFSLGLLYAHLTNSLLIFSLPQVLISPSGRTAVILLQIVVVAGIAFMLVFLLALSTHKHPRRYRVTLLDLNQTLIEEDHGLPSVPATRSSAHSQPLRPRLTVTRLRFPAS